MFARRLRFRLSTLAWIMIVASAYFGGRASMFSAIERHRREALEAKAQLGQVYIRQLAAELREDELRKAIDAGTAFRLRRVTGVLDDNTLMLRPLFTNERYRARIYGVCLPEQPKPNKMLFDFCVNKDGRVVERGFDGKGRLLVDVIIDGKNLSAELIAAGEAWCDEEGEYDERLGQLEAEARAKKRGVWR